jgi:hypothetical protein
MLKRYIGMHNICGVLWSRPCRDNRAASSQRAVGFNLFSMPWSSEKSDHYDAPHHL